jgi:hypothetical protein
VETEAGCEVERSRDASSFKPLAIFPWCGKKNTNLELERFGVVLKPTVEFKKYKDTVKLSNGLFQNNQSHDYD